jgi:hypothetical protein
VRKLTPAEVAKMSVQDRCARILDDFDEWLAIRRLQFELKHEDLPQLNDAFRDYFAGMRTARGSGGSSCA